MDSVASAKTQYILNEKVSQSKEAVKKLKKALKEVKDAQQHLHEKGQHLRDALNVVASHESFKPLSQLVSMCSDKVKKVEEERMSNICTRMEDTVTKRMEALMKDVEHMDVSGLCALRPVRRAAAVDFVDQAYAYWRWIVVVSHVAAKEAVLLVCAVRVLTLRNRLEIPKRRAGNVFPHVGLLFFLRVRARFLFVCRATTSHLRKL